jgi:hypothetical protein
MKRRHSKFKFSRFFLWFITLTIGVWLGLQLMPFLNIDIVFLNLLTIGLAIEFVSKIMQRVRYKNHIVVNKWFLFWMLMHSAFYYIASSIVGWLNIDNIILWLLLVGLIITLFTHIIWKIRINKTKFRIGTIVLLLLLFVFSSSTSNTSELTMDLETTSPGGSGILDSINNVIGSIGSITGSCPQIDIPIINHGHILADAPAFLPTDNIREYEGWQIKVEGFSARPTLIKKYTDIGINTIYCHKGNKKGENPSYFYCGGIDSGYVTYIVKTEISPDGTIGDTIEKSFVNIYNSDGKFIKTKCGKDPDSIYEDEFKDTMREIEDFFTF